MTGVSRTLRLEGKWDSELSVVGELFFGKKTAELSLRCRLSVKMTSWVIGDVLGEQHVGLGAPGCVASGGFP